jgi:hypothetical protein
MRFKEFYNLKDHPEKQPVLNPMDGLTVPPLTPAKLLNPLKPVTKPSMPTQLLGQRPVSQQAMPKNPGQFLARRGSSIRPGF